MIKNRFVVLPVARGCFKIGQANDFMNLMSRRTIYSLSLCAKTWTFLFQKRNLDTLGSVIIITSPVSFLSWEPLSSLAAKLENDFRSDTRKKRKKKEKKKRGRKATTRKTKWLFRVEILTTNGISSHFCNCS